MSTLDLPANQLALADAFKALSKRPRTKKQLLDQADDLMFELRERGFRLVPFPPLKTRRKSRRKSK